MLKCMYTFCEYPQPGRKVLMLQKAVRLPAGKIIVIFVIAFTVIASARACAAGAGAENAVGLKLLLSQSDIDRIVWNINNVAWASAHFERMKADVDKWRDREPDIPERGGGWTQNYVAPDTGRRLEYNRDEPHRHRDPSTGKYHEGELLDAAWRAITHHNNIRIAQKAALLYQLTGDDWYAGFARTILVRYAKAYKHYPPHGGPAGLGRITAQSLGEAKWLINACATFDLIADSPAMSAMDRSNIIKLLLIPAARHIRMFPFGIHNIQVWQSVSILMTGLVSGRGSLVEFAEEDLRKQIELGITDEGMWYERSVGYHLFVLKPFQALAAVCRNSNLDLCEAPRLKKLFTSITALVMPDGSLPALNDGGRGNTIHDAMPGLVVARWAFNDTSLDSIINHLGNSKGWDNVDDTVFMYYVAPESAPPVWAMPRRSSHMPDTGITVLRLGEQYALIKYNPPCGAHDHYDRLGLIYYSGGHELFPDPGTISYGHPLYRSWYRTTEAHNTIMIDGKQQIRVPCDALAFEDNKYFTGVSVECKGIDEQVNAMRAIVLTGDGMIDVTYVEAAEAHTIDWILHADGPSHEPRSVYPNISPNPEIKLSVKIDFQNSMTTFWIRRSEEQKNVATTLTPFTRGTIYEGTATGFYPDTRLPVMIWRQNGDKALFTATSSSKEMPPEAVLEGEEVVVPLGKLKVRINIKTGAITSTRISRL